MNTKGRKAETCEPCTRGRQAVTVCCTEDFGEVGWCGRSDGGDRSGPCPFCGGGRHDWPLCPDYRIRLDWPLVQSKGRPLVCGYGRVPNHLEGLTELRKFGRRPSPY